MKFFLIVDDNQKFIEANKLFIKSLYDAEVDCACNGQEALEKIQLFEYDVILSDIEMPVMNGAELYREIKEKNPAIVSKMAFISGNVHGTDAISIKEEGIPLLSKPFKPQELIDIINSIIDS